MIPHWFSFSFLQKTAKGSVFFGRRCQCGYTLLSCHKFIYKKQCCGWQLNKIPVLPVNPGFPADIKHDLTILLVAKMYTIVMHHSGDLALTAVKFAALLLAKVHDIMPIPKPKGLVPIPDVWMQCSHTSGFFLHVI